MQALCQLSDFTEGQAKGFEINGTKLVGIKYRDNFYLYENSCPHRSIPLEWQPDQFLDYDKTFIQCATHGALFQINTGLCISGPCVEDRLTAIPFQLAGDQVMIDL